LEEILIKCDICKDPVGETNIGYVKTLEKGRRIFECKSCHRRKKLKEKSRKLSSKWIFVA